MITMILNHSLMLVISKSFFLLQTFLQEREVSNETHNKCGQTTARVNWGTVICSNWLNMHAPLAPQRFHSVYHAFQKEVKLQAIITDNPSWRW